MGLRPVGGNLAKGVGSSGVKAVGTGARIQGPEGTREARKELESGRGC